MPNEHILRLDVDIMHHLGLDTHNYDLPAMFGDIKVIIIILSKAVFKVSRTKCWSSWNISLYKDLAIYNETTLLTILYSP